jgi:hypothetical protein
VRRRCNYRLGKKYRIRDPENLRKNCKGEEWVEVVSQTEDGFRVQCGNGSIWGVTKDGKYPANPNYDIVQEYDVTNKAQRINDKIEAIPGVCQDGKKAIRALLEEVTGEKLAGPVPKAGQVYEGFGKTPYILMQYGSNGDWYCTSLRDFTAGAAGRHATPEAAIGTSLKFAANTLKEYVANGGKL